MFEAESPLRGIEHYVVQGGSFNPNLTDKIGVLAEIAFWSALPIERVVGLLLNPVIRAGRATLRGAARTGRQVIDREAAALARTRADAAWTQALDDFGMGRLRLAPVGGAAPRSALTGSKPLRDLDGLLNRTRTQIEQGRLANARRMIEQAQTRSNRIRTSPEPRLVPTPKQKGLEDEALRLLDQRRRDLDALLMTQVLAKTARAAPPMLFQAGAVAPARVKVLPQFDPNEEEAEAQDLIVTTIAPTRTGVVGRPGEVVAQPEGVAPKERVRTGTVGRPGEVVEQPEGLPLGAAVTDVPGPAGEPEEAEPQPKAEPAPEPELGVGVARPPAAEPTPAPSARERARAEPSPRTEPRTAPRAAAAPKVAPLRPETRVATRGRPRVRPPPPRFRLPDGSELPPGVFPRIVQFGRGVVLERVDLQTGRRTFSKKPRGVSGNPEESFSVVKTTDQPPKVRSFVGGLFKYRVGRREVTFRRRSGL